MRSFARPTLKDVALLCGVSEITVSRVMRGAPNTSAKTRLKVLQAAQQLNYAPNRLAGALASRSSDLLAVIVPSMTHSVFPEVLDGIDSVLRETRYRTVLGISHYDLAHEENLIDDLLSWNPAGIAVTGFEHTAEAQRALREFSNPVLEIMDADGEPIDCSLGVSHVLAGSMMAEHLVARGYRKMAYVGAWNERPTRSRRRRIAFEERLAELGKPLVCSVIEEQASSMLLGQQACAEVLRKNPEVDAIFFANDDLVSGALLYCLSAGIAVPGRLALAGFNGLPMTQAMPLRITTIQTPRYDMGVAAARLFLQRIELNSGKADLNRKVCMPLTLLQGDTT
jgi:LacI family transcriptional regulator, gluconate utilization system Gnt-I transcriptional repressor